MTEVKFGKLTDGNITVTLVSSSGTTKITRVASTGSNWPATGSNIAKDITEPEAEIYPVWRVDKYGKVLVLMSDSGY